jgi:alkylation response protein AidB-like acyl-CoA dehydrogenase
VERGYEGITFNAEEHKMGIKGSSTRQIFFNDVKVPVENLLSERQNGFKIAVNILNLGRIKLAGAALGGAKRAINQSIQYATERQQFGRPISKYGAIQHKLAEQAIRVFACESATYRCSQNIDDAIEALTKEGMEPSKAKLKGVEQFAAEAAILKVHGSEVLDFVVDEGVQIYGGMGYSAEAPMDRAYRDARINRIFEGTNEINRMLTVDMLLKRAMKGELDLMGPAQKVAAELMNIPEFGDMETNLITSAKNTLSGFKKAVLMVAGAAVQKLMTTLAKEQEVLMNIADMIIDVYVAESLMLRVEKMHKSGKATSGSVYDGILRVFINDAAVRIHTAGREAVCSFSEGDELRMLLMGLKRFTKTEPVNTKNLRREIASKLISENAYNL